MPFAWKILAALIFTQPATPPSVRSGIEAVERPPHQHRSG